MNAANRPKPKHWIVELRVALVCAALMPAIPFGVKLGARYGWGGANDLSERALMVILAAFIVLTGNTIPKRVTSRTCAGVDPARLQVFHRFAGWTWVLTGLAFGLASILLPTQTSRTATLVIVPAGMALIAYRWLNLLATRRPAA